MQTRREGLEGLAGFDFDPVSGARLRDIDVDGAAGLDGVELDLLDPASVITVGVGGALGFDFGGACFNPIEGAVDVIDEDFLGLVVRCSDAG